MEHIPLIDEFLVIFALSIAVLLLCYRARIPAVVGFLLTGIICGPYGFGFVQNVEDVQSMANVGIILLLFTIGMEVSIKKIIEMKRLFLVGGGAQVGLTMLGGYLVARMLGCLPGEAVFLGCVLALSSTAVVLKMLVQKGESDTPHGRGTLATLIFQDFCAVPMMLITPVLAGAEMNFNLDLLYSALKGIAIIVGVFAAASWLVPVLLYRVARTRNRELFLLTIFSICLSVAWFSQLAGLSLSLGAFLAGLIISQSDFSHEAISDITPFQELFTSFFFISVGMLLDVRFVAEHPIIIIALALVVIAVKSTMATLAGMIAGLPLRTAAWMGITLAQISEFSFVLAKVGSDNGITKPFEYQLFLAVAILSIALTPWLINYAHVWAGLLDALPLPRRYKVGFAPPKEMPVSALKDHVIIIGFGLAGRALAKSCKDSGIPYVIVEMNAVTVRQEHLKGEPIHYGDASHDSVLEHVKIHDAKVVAVVINDPVGSVRIVKKVKQINHSVYLIVRTRYVQEVKYLYSLGADDVIPDEYGSAVEVFTRVLQTYGVEREKIQKIFATSLLEGYNLLRMQYVPDTLQEQAPKTNENSPIKSFRIAENSPYQGKSIHDWKKTEKTNLVVALKRGQETLTTIDSSIILEKDDVIYVIH
ncbi:MAG: cation:proton antiporter [Parachlamydiales bacterium]|jgi:CPA2 family monovalent cation:H+ antiporter-2